MTRTPPRPEPTALSRVEQDVYARLLGTARTAAELAATGRRTRARIEAVLSALESEGLVVSLPTTPRLYAALPPETVARRVRVERARSLAAARALLTRLSATFDTGAGRRDEELAEIVVGERRSHAAFNEILAGARSEVRACESAYSLRQGTSVGGAVKAQIQHGVRFRVLYDRGGLDHPERLADLNLEMTAGEVARIGDVPFKLLLTDEPMGWLALRLPAYGNFARLRIRDATLISALGHLFETLWEQAMPIPSVSATTSDGAAARLGPLSSRTDGDATLSWLLAAGLSERAIAEYLGCHERTARRRIRDMMVRLDAHTAFQAGYQLVRRGYQVELDPGTTRA